tara:strand:- start:426 stop:620 length:195 start_codon:yes stop_codon:yes gene_type:complete
VKKIKNIYKKAYNLYLERIEKRTHRWGKTQCLVCDTKYDKTNGKHLYCSRECRLINGIYKENIC